jgi:hypothetical protein
MPKPIRAVIVCCALLLAASLSVATVSVAKSAGNPAAVKFTAAPKKFVCLNDLPQIVISYSWDKKSGVEQPFPLAPLVLPGTPQPDTPKPGTLETTASLGAVTTPSAQVEYGPGLIHMHYFPEKEGSETLVTTLSYGTYTKTASASFKVGTCNYNLVIKAWNDQTGSGTTDTSYFSAEGPISIADDNTISGELRTDVWLDIVSTNPVEDCQLVPIPMGKSTLTVSGTMDTDWLGNTTMHMNIKYNKVEMTPKSANVDCVNKVDKSKIEKPFNYPPSANPGDYLLSVFDFVNMAQIVDTYGKGGQAYYIIEKLK